MEEAPPLREEMDGRVVYLPSELAFFYFEVIIYKVLFPVCTLTWRVNSLVSRKEKV